MSEKNYYIQRFDWGLNFKTYDLYSTKSEEYFYTNHTESNIVGKILFLKNIKLKNNKPKKISKELFDLIKKEIEINL
jgi:hypothetical protein